jgi:hypothetical protein
MPSPSTASSPALSLQASTGSGSSPAIAATPKTQHNFSTGTSSTADGYSHRRDPVFVIVAILASAIFSVIIWITRTTFSEEASKDTGQFFEKVFRMDAGDTITVLSVLSGALGAAMTTLLDMVFESVQWAFVGRSWGVSMSTALALSPTTGIIGTLQLMITKEVGNATRTSAGLK